MFNIGKYTISRDLALAPMDGLSDHPFRKICREYGSGFVITEFINSMDVSRKLNDLEKRVAFSDDERPIGFQIYGNDPKRIVTAAVQLQTYGPDFIDLNLGCADRRVVGRGAGSALLKDPKLIEEITKSLVKDLDIPVTAKMRLGWQSDEASYLEIARVLEDSGISMLSVHGRYRDENWNTPAHWGPIADIKTASSIPVIGNGDVVSIEDVREIVEKTGCDAVMIGRAAIGNPWIFSGTEKRTISREIITQAVLYHWKMMKDFYGVDKAQILFKKHFKAYLDCEQFRDVNMRDLLRSEKTFDQIINGIT